MIFVTVGSQKFQFNRLLIEIDKLIEDKKITEEVFAQIGYSDYNPKNYNYKRFLNRDEFNNIMEKCDKVITHGGTGTIISAIKKEKKVIAIPRLMKYGEHVDDHQKELLKQFFEMNLICCCNNCEKIIEYIKSINEYKFKSYYSNTFQIIKSLEDFIEKSN